MVDVLEISIDQITYNGEWRAPKSDYVFDQNQLYLDVQMAILSLKIPLMRLQRLLEGG